MISAWNSSSTPEDLRLTDGTSKMLTGDGLGSMTSVSDSSDFSSPDGKS